METSASTSMRTIPSQAGSPVAPAAPAKPARNRMAALDGLRFLAAMFVLAFHYLGNSGGNWGGDLGKIFPSAHHTASYGFLGVEFFFLISGFVICMSSWGRGLGSFFASRASRLYPAYWAAVILTTLLYMVKPAAGTAAKPSAFLMNLTMLHFSFGVPNVDGVYWTLWLELRFYLLFALVVWRGVTYRRVVAFCLLWTTASILIPSFNNPVLHGIIQEDYSPYFIAGIAMYLMHRYRPSPLLWAIVGTQWILAQYQVGSRVVEGTRQTGAHLTWTGGTVLVTLFFLAVLAVSLGWLDWARWRWLTFLGSLTYPLYLVHEAFGLEMVSMWHGHMAPWALVGLATAASLVLATLIRTFVEKPVTPRLRRAMERSFQEMRLQEPPLRKALASPVEPAVVTKEPVVLVTEPVVMAEEAVGRI